MKELANYCLGCPKKPCQTGCPLINDTAGFIKLIKEEKYQEAYNLLCETTVLSSICGRICPHDKQCQGHCIRGIKGEPVSIGKLESYIGDLAIDNNWPINKYTDLQHKEKIAIIGGGPAGLTCAATLARHGYNVTIYEKHNYLGGILYHGIPSFRLDKELLNKVIQKILDLGIEVKLNQELGCNYSLEQLENEYEAVFLGFGANLSNKMQIPGEDLKGVYGGNELLENKILLDIVNKTIVVSGGGNVAMDVSRTLKHQGAKRVIVVYRRSEKEMPAEVLEINEAKNEGIEFMFQTNIINIKGNKKVSSIECLKTELVKDEKEDRLKPVNIENSNFYIDCDYVIMAIGSHPEDKIIDSLNLEKTNKNYLQVNDKYQTSNKKIFAGGDLAGVKQTVAFASRSGRDAAESIIKYLTSGE